MYQVDISPQAEAAVDEISAYLASFSHSSDIEKVDRKIDMTIASLSDMPTRHRLYLPPIAHKPKIRCADAGKFVVYFTVDEVALVVGVIDVQHRKRDPAVVRARLV